MDKIVADTSVRVKWLTTENENYVKQANQVLQDAKTGKITIFAPELSKYELGNAILRKKMVLPLALDALGTASTMPITYVSETRELAFATYQIAESASITYYDASFLALAKQEKATLITDNPKHQKKIKGIKVIALKNYR